MSKTPPTDTARFEPPADVVHFELPPKKYDAFVNALEEAEKIPPNEELKRLMRQKAPWEK